MVCCGSIVACAALLFTELNFLTNAIKLILFDLTTNRSGAYCRLGVSIIGCWQRFVDVNLFHCHVYIGTSAILPNNGLVKYWFIANKSKSLLIVQPKTEQTIVSFFNEHPTKFNLKFVFLLKFPTPFFRSVIDLNCLGRPCCFSCDSPILPL